MEHVHQPVHRPGRSERLEVQAGKGAAFLALMLWAGPCFGCDHLKPSASGLIARDVSLVPGENIVDLNPPFNRIKRHASICLEFDSSSQTQFHMGDRLEQPPADARTLHLSVMNDESGATTVLPRSGLSRHRTLCWDIPPHLDGVERISLESSACNDNSGHRVAAVI